MPTLHSRRDFHRSSLSALNATWAVSAFGGLFLPEALAQDDHAPSDEFRFRYLLGSCLYGYLYIGEILPEVRKVGADAIDIWPKPHGNQREQLHDLGIEKFQELLDRHRVNLGCITQYALGPLKLQGEMKLAQQFDCKTIVTGAVGPRGLKGSELKQAVRKFIEQMKPHLDVAQANQVTIAIENHGHSLIDSPDSLKWLAELRPNSHLAIALAPYHLAQDAQMIAELVRDVAPSIEVFYAWQHGNGCMKKLPKEEELLQLPGRGPLDFVPIVEALKEVNYTGWTEIFMHPVPRGIPILPTADEVTHHINQSRDFLARAKNDGA